MKPQRKPLIILSSTLIAALLCYAAATIALAADPLGFSLAVPQPGDYALHILTPNLLELTRINAKQPDPAHVDSWDWVNQGSFGPLNTASVKVVINGQTNNVTAVGFKRRPIYAPLFQWDLRVGNQVYLQFNGHISDGATVRVVNNGTLWPANMDFVATADPVRLSPAIHVNQEGYLPNYPKKAEVGYYLGDMGEMAVPTNRFMLVDAQSGATVFQGTLTLRQDVGYNYTPTPYQNVYEADFSSFTTSGAYRLMVPGMGASYPFRIDEGIAMNFARTYAMGIYLQRSGTAITMPFSRFTHAVDHLAPANIPTNATPPFDFTWFTVSNYVYDVNTDNPTQLAPQLTNYNAQLFPFINQGQVQVSGGHFEAGDYNRVTYNAAQVVHVLMFAADSLPGVGALDNLGIPESGDGISDIMQEAKWEADFIAKMQDADGGFYYSVYPRDREYELDVLPENGDPQVVWPKNTACTAAAVAALAQCSSSPRFKQAYPQAASNYWAKALLGWHFLTNAIARYGLDGAYQKIQGFGDTFTDRDDLAWAACELYLATGNSQFQQKLFEWFPDPTSVTTFRFGWTRMYACYGNAVRDYAFASQNGRLTPGQLDQNYRGKCITTITNCGDDNLLWSQQNAYGTSFPPLNKAYRGGGWYFSSEQAFDIVVAYQFNPRPEYMDAILLNLNYEGGANPVNMPYLTGIGWKRMRNVIDQYSANDKRALVKDGVPVSNITGEFLYTWVYGSELRDLVYPGDYIDNGPYAYYDRWCDDWNVSTEGSTTDTVRGLAGIAWLAARTALTSQAWHFTNATISGTSSPRLPGQSVTAALQVADPNLTGARIAWEAQGQEPTFGSQSYTFTAGTVEGQYWIEAEVQWPDGRRAFATNSITVSSNGLPQLNNARRLAGGAIAFDLAGSALATYYIQASTNLINWQSIGTNTLPASGTSPFTDSQGPGFARRYYRAMKAP